MVHLLGRVAYFEGDAQTARARGQESRAIAREIEDEWLEAWALHLLGLAAHIENDFSMARQHYGASLAIRERLGFREGTGTILSLIGNIDYSEGNYAAAREHYGKALTLIWGIDSGWLIGNLTAAVAALAVRLGQPARAVRLLGGLATLNEAVSTRPIPLVEAIVNPAMEEAQRVLGAAAFAAEHQAGRHLTLDEIVAEALAIEMPDQAVEATPVSGVAHATAEAPSTTQAAPAGLTAREIEVLQLIAAGCTSQEIADQLVISIHTVERHITHVYQKIGARGRAEATAFALTHALA
jgi:DNA-binding CsgD family transcriptional regulator